MPLHLPKLTEVLSIEIATTFVHDRECLSRTPFITEAMVSAVMCV